jgi:hypothetical protein
LLERVETVTMSGFAACFAERLRLSAKQAAEPDETGVLGKVLPAK